MSVSFEKGLRLSILAALIGFVFVLSSCREESEYVDPGSSSLGVGTIKGVVRGGGALLEGATVETNPSTITDSTSAIGEYSLDGLSPASIDIIVTKSGFVTQSRRVSIVAGKTYSVNFDLVPSTALGHLTGTITDGYIPLEGVTVSTVPPSFSSVTGLDGRYDYNNVTPGNYRIDAKLVGFWPGRIFVNAESGTETEGNMSLARRNDGTIAGKVIDSAGNAVSGALVSIFWDSESEFVTTAGDGKFSFSSLTTGYYIVTASAVNYYSGSHSLQAYGGVETNGTVVLSLTSTPAPVPGAITGTVWDLDYSPLSGAVVTLDPASATPVTTTTITDGTYYFSGVASATHTLSAGLSGYTSSTISVDVGSNVTADGTFTLKGTG